MARAPYSCMNQECVREEKVRGAVETSFITKFLSLSGSGRNVGWPWGHTPERRTGHRPSRIGEARSPDLTSHFSRRSALRRPPPRMLM